MHPKTGTNIPAADVDSIARTIRTAVPAFSGGVFSAGTIETGSGERADRLGVINVILVHEPEADYCGRAKVGANPGQITLNYDVDVCRTPCGAVPPFIVAHEVGHAMGFFHVSQGTVMNTRWLARDCGVTAPSGAEQHHARIAYRRARGNRDGDFDPTSFSLLHGPDAAPPVITCYH